MRPIASGLWIPSEALEGWRVQYRGVNPTNILATYTHEDPTPLIVRSTWQLDPIGNTIKGTLALTEHPYRDPFSFAARLELLAYDTYHPIWEGMFVSLDAESGGSGSGGLYALEFDSLQRKVLQKYWHGFAAGTLPPAIPQLNVNATHNLSGLELPDIAGPLEQGGNSNLMVKVSDVISKAL